MDLANLAPIAFIPTCNADGARWFKAPDGNTLSLAQHTPWHRARQIHRVPPIAASHLMGTFTMTNGCLALTLFALSLPTLAQAQTAQPVPATPQAARNGHAQTRSPGGDVGSGAGDIGKGAGKGAGDLAKGTGKGAVDLVTLHPLNAAGEVGKGGVSAGKNIAVGAGKGTGKVAKGTGRAIKHIF